MYKGYMYCKGRYIYTYIYIYIYPPHDTSIYFTMNVDTRMAVVDPMHCLYLGVVKTTVQRLITSNHLSDQVIKSFV